MRRIVLAGVVLFGFGSQAFGQAAPDVATLCPPAPTKGEVYEIDLATATAGTKVHYRPSDQVKVIFRNKNPFLFDYRIKIEEKALPEPDLAALFKLLNASGTIPVVTAINPLISSSAVPPGEPATCIPAMSRARTALTQEQDAALRIYAGVKQQAEANVALLDALQKSVTSKEEKLKDASAQCESLASSAIDLVKTIEDGLDETKPGAGQALKSFKAEFERLQKEVSAFDVLIAAQRIVLDQQGCRAGTIDEVVKPFATTLGLLKESLDPKNEKGIQKVATDLATAVKDLNTKRETVAGVLKNPRNFQEIQTIGDYDEITLVTITVDRKKREEKDYPSSPFLTKKLRFGGRQRFALAMGAAFSGIDTATFKAVQGLPLNQDGTPAGTDAARIVAVDDQSNQRISPLVVLHTRLSDRTSWIGFHFSLGFAGSTGGNGVNLEYLVGPSLSFAEERFFLTFGVYNGRTQRLQDGFWVGRKLPDTIPDAPIVKGRSWDWGVAATYKLR